MKNENSDKSLENQNVQFAAIFDYEMDEMESKAYKVCLLWLEKSKKVFPDYKHATLKSGDPRKSLMFKMCYKFVRETNTILEEKEYPLYVRAQLDVLRHLNTGNIHLLISPNCLVGDKAWKRWKLWKKKYDAVSVKPIEVSQPVGAGEIKAITGIEKTKEFISKTFGVSPTLEQYQEAYSNNNLTRWINFGKISPYYLVVSPFIEKIMNLKDFEKLNFDPKFYQTCITNRVMIKFREVFPNELM